MTLGIIGAMDSEVAALVAAIENKESRAAAGTVFHSGTIAGKPVVVAKCGVGKVCAAMCTQVLVDLYHVDGIVNTGVAGGVAPGMAVGDLVVATAAVQHDFDLSAVGDVKGSVPAGGGDGTAPTLWHTDKALSAAFSAAAERVKARTGGSFTCRGGVVASGDVFVADTALKQALRQDFDAVAAEMEGAAMAQAATLNGVPCAVIRAISDLADGEADISFSTFEEQAAALSAAIVIDMLREM